MATMSIAAGRSNFLLDLSRQLLTSAGLLRSSAVSIASPATAISIPSLVSDIWEGILRAVPKKKTSHMKRRHRFMANNKMEDVKAINKCPGCGKPKKRHHLCPYCVSEIRNAWNSEKEASRTDLQAP